MFSHKIAILVPDMTNQFFSELAQQVQRHVVSANGVGIVLSSDSNKDLELSHIELVKELRVDGMVFISVGDNHDVYATLSNGPLPYVVLDREVPDTPNCDFVLSDNVLGTRLVVEHLHAQGHRAIGYLAGDLSTEPGRARKETFLSTMADLQLQLAPEWLFDGDFSLLSGHAAAKALLALAHRPTALACANDFMAVGVIQALSEAGLNIPEELSVIGYDDIPLASWIYPRLTTVRQEVVELARNAVEVLMKRIGAPDPDATPQLRSIPPRLVERNSVAKIA